MKLKALPRHNLKDPVGDPEGVVFHPDDLQEDGNIVLWAKDVAAILERHYPGWLWGVTPDPRGRVMTITSFRLTNEWGYVINLHQTPIEDPGVRTRVVLEAGGEILERFGMARGRYDHAAFMRSPKALTGDPRMDVTDKDRHLQRFSKNEEFDRALRTGAMDLRVVDRVRQGQVQREVMIRPGKRYADKTAR